MPEARAFARLDRRSLVLGAGAALAGPARAATPAFQFGLTPVFLTNDLVLLEALQEYLARAIDGPVRLVLRRTYQEITALLASGRLDAAWICGFPFVVNRAVLELVAVPLWRGRPEYQSYVIVQRERSVDSLGDLSGDVHAFSDPDSNSGFLVTRAALAADGHTVDQYFRRSFFTYGHRNVVRAVASGLAQSGSVDGYVWEVMAETEPELTGRTKVVRRSEWMGFPPIAAPRGQLAANRMRAFGSALFAMPHQPLGRQILSSLRLDGFVRGDILHFERIERLVEAVRRVE